MPNKRWTKLSDALPAMPEDQAFFDDIANKFTKTAPKEEPPRAAASKVNLPAKEGKLIILPTKDPDDLLLRLEQNLGCELPICVSNRRDVRQESIRVSVDGDVVWELTRLANRLLPAPEHYPIWLWLLDRLSEAAERGEKEPPKIAINPSEVHRIFPSQKSGSQYINLDEGLRRISGLNIDISRAFFSPTGKPAGKQQGQYGALCTYISWRTTDPEERASLIGLKKGWIIPCRILWDSVLNGYMKAVPLQPLRQVNAYVAQRLLVYLSKHCKPGGVYKVSMAKLLPKIPAQYPSDQVKRKLKPHHQELCKISFLAREPIFDGRGNDLMVTYERTRQGF